MGSPKDSRLACKYNESITTRFFFFRGFFWIAAVHYRRVCIFHHYPLHFTVLVVDGPTDWLRKSRSYTHVIWWLMYPHFQSLISQRLYSHRLSYLNQLYPSLPQNLLLLRPTLSNRLYHVYKGTFFDYMFVAFVLYACRLQHGEGNNLWFAFQNRRNLTNTPPNTVSYAQHPNPSGT
jgi:hypothetical protein